MTDEQKAAFVNAQAALLNGRIAAMQAENQHRISCGNSIAYGADEIQAEVESFEAVIGHNACIELFHNLKRG